MVQIEPNSSKTGCIRKGNPMQTWIVAAAAVSLGLVGAGWWGWNFARGKQVHVATDAVTSFYELSATTLEGKPFDFSQLKGKRVIIVNTASKCGYTPQYAELEALHKEWGGKGLVILGFPCNDFGRQEPGDATEIGEFCERNYGVTFTMMEKVSVKGDAQHPVYAWLCKADLNGVGDHDVKWNFHKFLINENGQLVASLRSGVSPKDAEIQTFARGK
jgi:glutathione peroxidase